MYLYNIEQKQKNLNKLLIKLAKLNIHKQLQKRKNGNTRSISSGNGYFESAEYFRNRFLIEKRRSERKSYDFAIIIINIETKAGGIHNHDSFEQSKEIVLAALKTILRDTDVISKYCPSKLAILLPDTNHAGAQHVIERIHHAVNEIDSQKLLNIMSKTKLECYCYPAQANELEKLMDDKLFSEKKSSLALEKTIMEIRSSHFPRINPVENSKKSRFQLNSNHAITLENPFCLLNEVFFDVTKNWQKLFKRYFDFIISLMAIVVLSPLFALISIFIKLTSRGPVFFKQGRIGYMGKIFTIYKFRTMYQSRNDQIHKQYVKNFIKNCTHQNRNSNKDSQIYKITNDPRVTAIGKFLRRTSLDEIGQFFNVLKGDMSLVGPRPPIPYEVEMYDYWHKRRFLTTKPGITGLWQIYGRNTIEFNDMVRLDIAYAKNWSLSLDFKIILKTITAVFSMKGAY